MSHSSRLLSLAVRGMLTTESTVLIELQLIWRISLVLRCSVIALLAFRAGKRHDITHDLILAPLLPFTEEGIIANYLAAKITR